MRTADFDYELPERLIAQTPAEPRDSARLMVVDRAAGTIAHQVFRELPSLLHRGDVLVVNDTRVMAARLRGRREETGGAVEALLVRQVGPRTWEMMLRPGRQGHQGAELTFTVSGREVRARVIGRAGDLFVGEFGEEFDPATAGEVPLPPYIHGYPGDPERYQTIYHGVDARSAAAPTAGLHFTTELFDRLDEAGVARAAITLDVGPGTFKPVSVEDPRQHTLHHERVTVPAAAARAITTTRAAGGRVVAVGTTVVRTLEHVAREHGDVASYSGETGLMLLPGARFHVVDALITNFHLPRSTLLMLVAAFSGYELAMEAYRTAVREEYRFYSFGDAMLIL